MKNFITIILLLPFLLFAKSVDKELIENTHIKIVYPQDMIHYLNNLQTDKPIFIFLSAEDGGCIPCDLFNNTISDIATHSDRIDFLYVKFDHYTDINNYPNILERYQILGLPTSFIMHDGKILDKTTGNTKKERILMTINAALQKVNQSAKNIFEKEIEEYLSAKSYKASYIAVDDDNNKTVFSATIGAKSPKDAMMKASRGCLLKRAKKSIIDRCKLYMLEDIYLYDKEEKIIRETIESLTN